LTVNWVFGEVLFGIIVNITVVAYFYGKTIEKLYDLERRVGELEVLAPRVLKGAQ
jgi:hypothetical protein